MAAHPRRCGENLLWLVSQVLPCGSSPQVRGKRIRKNVVNCWGRLIPAGAGKTSRYVDILSVLPAHPRRCGENALCYLSHRRAAGSSPQVRGKQLYDRASLHGFRLIPAGAGKTPGHAW